MLEQNEHFPNKSQLVNERLAEIERIMLELIFEKKTCLELKGEIEQEAFKPA